MTALSQLPNYMGVFMLMATLFLFGTVYQYAGISWKTKPWIPLIAGLVILVGAYFVTLTLNGQAKDALSTSELALKQGDVRAGEVLKALAEADEHQSKLLELVTIPLALSLIATALFSNADRAFQAKINEYEERRSEIERREFEIDEEDDAFEKDLDNGIRGKDLLDRHKTIRRKRLDLFNERDELWDDYSELIEARLVPSLNRGNRRKSRRTRDRQKK